MAFSIKVMSFGYKYVNMPEASIVYDVRFVDNPYWDPAMRLKTGLDKEVSDYVLSVTGVAEFYENFYKTVSQTIALQKEKDDKRGIDQEFVIAFGCTGGQHRSVAFAQQLGRDLKVEGYDVKIEHRDLEESLAHEKSKEND